MMMNCQECGQIFERTHFNQKLCGNNCRVLAARKRNDRYKNTVKGHATEMRWRQNPKKKDIDRRYYTSGKGRARAVDRAAKQLRMNWWVILQKRLRDTAEYKRLRAGLIESIGMCQACGSREDLTIDHIVPISMGGKHERSNIQLLCRGCNARKKQEIIHYEMPILGEAVA